MTTSTLLQIERLPAVLARTGLGRSSLYAALARNEFPQPIKLGNGRAIGFLASEVDDWILVRAALRVGQQTGSSHV